MTRINTPLKTFPIGNDNQGGVSAPAGKYANTPVAPGLINPYTGNATRIVQDLSVPSIGEIGLNWTRYNNSRGGGLQYFGSECNWRHSYQWELSYTPGNVGVDRSGAKLGKPDILYTDKNDQYHGSGQITLTYPDGTVNMFIETGVYTGIFVSKSSQVTDYIIIDGTFNISAFAQHYNNYTNFKLINNQNQSYHFGLHAIYSNSSYFFLDSINDSKGLATTLSYTNAGNGQMLLDTVTEPGGRFLKIHYTGCVYPLQVGSLPSQKPITIYNVGEVDSSDSRSVIYSYYQRTIHPNPNTPSYFITEYDLVSAQYPDGTTASYTYQPYLSLNQTTGYWLCNSNLLTAQDTHAVGVPNIKYNYWTQQAGYSAPPVGSVQSVTELTSGTTISQIGLVSAENNTNAPVVVYPDQTGYAYYIQNGSGGLLQQSQNILANTNSNSFSYSGGTFTFTPTSDPNSVIALATGSASTTSTNSLGNSLTTTRSVLGRITSRTWPIVGSETTAPTENWTYNNDGYLISYTDTLLHSNTITRNSSDLIQKITYPDGTFESFTYGAFNQVATHTRRNGGVETFTYYTAADFGGVYNGFLKSVQDPQGGIKSYTYDDHYRVASVTNANNHTTSFQYNINGQITTITNPTTATNPTPTTLTFTYDNYGNLLTATNELGKTQTFTYDVFNRVLTSKDPLNRVTTNTYDPATPGNQGPILVTYPSGKKTAYTYQVGWGYKPWTVTTGAGTTDAATTTYAYDADGNVISITDPKGNLTKIGYDARDRTSYAIDSGSNQTNFTYDDASNLLTQQTPDGTTINVYDLMNRLSQSTDPKSQVTKMTYDAEGSLATYKEPGEKLHTYTYDLNERQLSMQYPDSTKEVYTYYPAGNLNTFKTRDGKVQTLTYDGRGRLNNSSWNDGVTPSVITTYDDASHPLTVSNSNSSIA